VKLNFLPVITLIYIYKKHHIILILLKNTPFAQKNSELKIVTDSTF